MPLGGEAVLTFENVHKRFDNCVALKEESFDVQSGEFTALAGPSGSGKTTVLNLAAGLDRVTSGCVRLLGQALDSMSEPEILAVRRNWVGFIFQSYNLLPVLTATENIEYPLALRGVDRKKRALRAAELLDDVGLFEFADRMPGQLSGGQQQRVAIARALAAEPKIIFADEPTANLDSVSAELLLDLFERLNRTHHLTFLFSSHDPRVLGRARRILSVQDGCVHENNNGLTLAHSGVRDSKEHHFERSGDVPASHPRRIH